MAVRLLAVALALATSPAVAQTPWSPFRSGADLADSAPSPPAGVSLLSRPTGFGFLWNAGNPAAAILDLEGRAVDFAVGAGRSFGAWHRPLDPVAATTPGLGARAWQPVGRRRVLAGSVAVNQHLLSPDGLSGVAGPYASIPFVPADTSRPDMHETAVRLDGLIGWALGPVATGVVVGYDTRDRRSSNSPVSRSDRSTTPAAAWGIVASVMRALQVGVGASWSRRNEAFRLASLGAVGHGYKLEGLGASGPISVPPEDFFRRLTTNRWEVGPEAGGILGPARWVLVWRLTRTSSDQTSVRLEDPVNDTWRARGATLRGAIRLDLPSVRIDARAGRSALSGEARLPELSGFIYSASESRAWVEATVRIGTLASSWQAAITAGTIRERRIRRDYLYERREEFTSWTPGVSASLAFPVGPGTWMSLDGGIATRLNSASIPDPAGLEESYLRFIAPALAWRAAQVVARRAGLGLRQQLGAGAIVLRAGYARTSPVGDPLPLQPEGDRRSWDLSLTMEW